MPTGYTYPVCDGTVTEFPEFALSCARAFGALIMMRDDPADAPIPEEFKPDTKYYDEKLAADKKRLDEVQAMTNAECDIAAQADHAKAVAYRTKYLMEKDGEASRLNTMLAKVRAWAPPSADHFEMKKFMIDQLTMSQPGDYAPAIPALLGGATWRQKQIDDLADSIVRAQKEIAEETSRAAGRTAWLKQLRASLEPQFA